MSLAGWQASIQATSASRSWCWRSCCLAPRSLRVASKTALGSGGSPKRCRCLPVGLAVVDRYAVVRAQVERVGRPKSDFDLVIACTALEQEATLVTHDAALKDGTIEGLLVEDWIG